MYDIMYKSFFKWNLDFWTHNAKAYEFGPVIGMIFYYPSFPQTYRTAQSFLSSIKGSALTEWLQPNTIRFQFNASNRVFNLVHIPDNITQAKVESYSWFGADNVRELIKRFIQSKSSLPYPYIIDEMNKQGYLYDRMLNGWASYSFVKLRILHVMKKQVKLTDSLIRAITILEEHYCRVSRELIELHVKRPNPKDFIASSFSIENDYLNEIIELLSHSSRKYHGEIVQMFKVLIDINQREVSLLFTLDFFWSLLLKWRIFMSELERYLIRTVLMYPTKECEK